MDTQELIRRAERLGVRVEFRSGLNIVKTNGAGDPERQREVIRELAAHLREVRIVSQLLAIATEGKKYVGARIVSTEYGAGTLVEASDEGTLAISISRDVRSSHEEEVRTNRSTVSAHAEGFLILLDVAEEDEISKPSDQNPSEEPPRKRFLGLL